MPDSLERVQAEVSGYLNDIAACFKPGVKLTLCVRVPDFPDRDFLMTSDDLGEVITMIQRRQAA